MEAQAGLVFGVIAAVYFWWRMSNAAQARREELAAEQGKIVCPHCNTVGQVTRTEVVRKQGVSGGKATAGLLTGGASLLLVGLSRKAPAMHMACSNCRMEWDVA